MAKAKIRLYSLNTLQLNKLAELEPSFMFDYLPWEMMRLRPDWVLKHHQEWVMDNSPSYLVNNSTNEALAKLYPELAFKMIPVSLVEHNPTFLIQHKREWVETFYPELLKEFSTVEYQKTGLAKKDKHKFSRWLIVLYRKTLGSFFGLFTAKNRSDLIADKNPQISDEVMALLDTPKEEQNQENFKNQTYMST